MKPEIITAIIAAVVAVTSAIISIYGQSRVTKLADRLAKQREAESRESQTAALISKYRDPLLRSAIDLQSRLWNIHHNKILQRSNPRALSEQDYLIHNTLYVIAEYLGWVEILRREVQFLDFGDFEMTRRLTEVFVNITQAFNTHRLDPTLQIFNGEQRAIGEIMMIKRSIDRSIGYECIGYATFMKRMSNPEFSRWFVKLKDSLETMVNEPEAGRERIVLIHSKVIDLIDFLDPHCLRVPPRYRTRIG
jgi:hypothetical protein